MLPQGYDPVLVVLSYAVALLGSYTGLSMGARLTSPGGRLRKAWWFGGAFAQATGIWSMHFTGMLALQLPIAIAYDTRLVILSLAIAFLGALLALYLAQRPMLGRLGTIAGGLSIGAGICGLHFTDMAAMRMVAHTHYDGQLVTLSIVIAIAFGLVSLLLGRRYRDNDPRRSYWSQWMAALLMGIAITGQHYTAMAAASFSADPSGPHGTPAPVLPHRKVPQTIFLATVLVLGGALASAAVDRRTGARAALSQRLLAAQENERRRIAGLLHDDVGQLLTAVRLNIARLTPEEQRRPDVIDSMALVNEALERIRALSVELRPSVLDDLGLAAAITWYANRVAERAGFSVEVVDSLGGRRLPEDIETAGFRIVQQALTNVATHARAKHVRILLRWQPPVLELAIVDDGAGFDVTAAMSRAAAGRSLGLLDMQEMATLAGGTFSATSTPGKGSTIEVRFPRAG